MPTFKISQLPAVTSIAGTEELEVNQAGTSRKATRTQLVAGLVSAGAVTGSGLTMSTARVLGRSTAGTGAIEEISIGSGLTLSAGTLSASGGGGGLVNFTDTATSATPNATVPVNALSATGSATAIDVAIVTKGGGSFALGVADNTVAGGNKRGGSAIDLQVSRDAADQVASGISSTAIGASNKAEANLSVAIGAGNSVTGISLGGAAIGYANTTNNNSTTIGNSNSVTGFNSAAIGESLTVSGNGAFAAGFVNTASGAYSSVPGGWQGTTNSIGGLLAYGFQGASLGRNQMSFFGARRETTNNTATRATSNGASESTTNQLTLRNSSAFAFDGKVVARDTTTNDMKAWELRGAIRRGANAAATAIVGTPTVSVIAANTSASPWTVALGADTTNGALAVTVTGETSKTIRWTVVIHSAEVN